MRFKRSVRTALVTAAALVAGACGPAPSNPEPLPWSQFTLGAGVTQGNAHATAGATSADGSVQAFISGASNLVPGDTNNTADVFVRANGTTTRIAEGVSGPVFISADGRFVSFSQNALVFDRQFAPMVAEIREHFDDEERLLLPLTRSEELRRRLLAEHGELRQLARKCENDPRTTASDPAMLRRLGTLLHDHIRWEERDFFEAVQRDHPEALAELVSEAGHIEARRPGSRARMSLTEECRAVPSTPAPHHMKEATMSDDRLRQAPAERFATDHLVFDLHAEIAALRAEPSSPRHGHRQKTLYKHAGRTVALFVMDAGAVLPEHAAGGTVTVQTIEGSIDVNASGRMHTLRVGMMLVMAPGVRHDVRATASAAFLLQVSLAADSVRT